MALLSEQSEKQRKSFPLIAEGVQLLSALAADPPPMPDEEGVAEEVELKAKPVEAGHVPVRFDTFDVKFACLNHHAPRIARRRSDVQREF